MLFTDYTIYFKDIEFVFMWLKFTKSFTNRQFLYSLPTSQRHSHGKESHLLGSIQILLSGLLSSPGEIDSNEDRQQKDTRQDNVFFPLEKIVQIR